MDSTKTAKKKVLTKKVLTAEGWRRLNTETKMKSAKAAKKKDK